MKYTVLDSPVGPLMLALAASSCASGGGGSVRAPQASTGQAAGSTDPTRASLEGEWRLLSMQMADGATRRVTGFLRYDRFANLTLRAELEADDPAARGSHTVVAAFTAKASPGAGELEYVGLHDDVTPDRLTADAVSMAEWRYFELVGDALRLFVRDSAGRPAATLVFQRGQ